MRLNHSELKLWLQRVSIVAYWRKSAFKILSARKIFTLSPPDTQQDKDLSLNVHCFINRVLYWQQIQQVQNTNKLFYWTLQCSILGNRFIGVFLTMNMMIMRLQQRIHNKLWYIAYIGMYSSYRESSKPAQNDQLNYQSAKHSQYMVECVHFLSVPYDQKFYTPVLYASN